MSAIIPEAIQLLDKDVQSVIHGSYLASLGDTPQISHDADRTYVDLVSAGLSLVAHADGIVTSVQLYARGYQGHSQFGGATPFGIPFDYSQKQVRDRLGKPTKSGGGVLLPVVGLAPMWDRYDESPIAFHVQYAAGCESIDMMSIMLLEAVERNG